MKRLLSIVFLFASLSAFSEVKLLISRLPSGQISFVNDNLKLKVSTNEVSIFNMKGLKVSVCLNGREQFRYDFGEVSVNDELLTPANFSELTIGIGGTGSVGNSIDYPHGNDNAELNIARLTNGQIGFVYDNGLSEAKASTNEVVISNLNGIQVSVTISGYEQFRRDFGDVAIDGEVLTVDNWDELTSGIGSTGAGGGWGVTDYDQLTGKPKINGIKLNGGDQTAADLLLASSNDALILSQRIESDSLLLSGVIRADSILFREEMRASHDSVYSKIAADSVYFSNLMDSLGNVINDDSLAFAAGISDLQSQVDEVAGSTVTSVNGITPVNGAITLWSENIDYDYGRTITDVITEDSIKTATNAINIAQNTSDIAGLKASVSRLPANNFGTATPAQSTLNAYATSFNVSLRNGLAVRNLYDNHLWEYSDVILGAEGWYNQGNDAINVATNSTTGIVQGSTSDYKVSVDGSGTMTVNGVQTAIEDLQDNKASNTSVSALGSRLTTVEGTAVYKVNGRSATNNEVSITGTDIITTGSTTVNTAISQNTTNISTLSQDKANKTDVVLLTTNQSVVGIKTFTSIPILPSTFPSSNNHATNKRYVDDNVATRVPSTALGTNGGVATLGSDGKVPSSQLAASVDQIIEVATYSALPVTGQSGKIYFVKSEGQSYRWGGTVYVQIASSMSLGETAGTAYEGTKGKAVTDALQQEVWNRQTADGVLENAISSISALAVGAEPAFTKNNAFNKNFGTTAGTVMQGNDSRLLSAVQSSAKGVANGIATLGANGRIPAAQLPGTVSAYLEYPSIANFPAVGADDVIYYAVNNGKSYRWTGSTYGEISSSLTLGETASTAYYGNKGASAYAHSQIISGNPHGTTPDMIGAEIAIGTKGTAFNKSYNTAASNVKKDGTASAGVMDNIARGDHVHPTDDSRAPLASPKFTGTPTTPTPTALKDKTKQVANTEWVSNYVQDMLGSTVPGVELSSITFVDNGPSTGDVYMRCDATVESPVTFFINGMIVLWRKQSNDGQGGVFRLAGAGRTNSQYAAYSSICCERNALNQNKNNWVRWGGDANGYAYLHFHSDVMGNLNASFFGIATLGIEKWTVVPYANLPSTYSEEYIWNGANFSFGREVIAPF
ncbi:hypothetical protein Barb7_00103 [Bacteroidales bacterium Barb7]|nr:hypothetical protein Barb7_00103 [Bacteroidales bacterium Barb7]